MQKIRTSRLGNWFYRVGIVAVFFLLIQVPPMAVVIANRYPANQELAITLAVIFVVLFLAIIAGARRVYRRCNQLPVTKGINWRLVVGGYAALLVGMMIFGWLNQWLFHQTSTANNEIIRQLLNHNRIITVVFVISSFTLTPIAEELIFRGILTNLFFRRNALWSKMVLSGLVFSAAHTSTTIVSFLLYCFMGMVLTYVYRQSGNLKNSILVHGINNLLAMLLMVMSLAGN